MQVTSILTLSNVDRDLHNVPCAATAFDAMRVPIYLLKHPISSTEYCSKSMGSRLRKSWVLTLALLLSNAGALLKLLNVSDVTFQHAQDGDLESALQGGECQMRW